MRLETHIDEQFCERAVSERRLEEAIEAKRRDLEALRARLDDEPTELEYTRLGRTLNRLGRYLRYAGECDEACALCSEAADIWRRLGRHRALFLARLRLAATEMRRGNHPAARSLADELVEAADDEPFGVYRDFALEVRGRIFARRGELDEARRDLRRALELRESDGRSRLVDRTRNLLELVDRLE